MTFRLEIKTNVELERNFFVAPNIHYVDVSIVMNVVVRTKKCYSDKIATYVRS